MAATRFKIPDLPDFFFELDDPKKEPIPIDNISVSGMGLQEDRENLPEIGTIISGTLRKGSIRVETKAKIIHKTNNVIGCQFAESSLPRIEKFVSDEVLKDLFPSLK